MPTTTPLRIAGGLLVTLVLLLLSAGCARRAELAARFHCPMHPTFVTTAPADCSICGMKVVPIPAEPEPEGVSGPTSRPAAGAKHRESGRLDTERATVTLAPDAIERSGVRMATARAGRLERQVHAAGRVVADESRIHTVTLRSGGFIERLHVNSLGQRVRAGESLLDLYAPELVAAQESFVAALDAAARFDRSELDEVRSGGRDLVEAARRRLEALGVPPTIVAALEADRTPRRVVTLPAPWSGVVTARDVSAGSRIEAGMPLLTLTDLDRVRVEADLREFEASAAGPGTPVRITPTADPGPPIAAVIDFVYPWLDGVTRTVRVRSEVDNPGFRLRPGQYVTVTLRVESGTGILVPDGAVLDTGSRRLVFVELTPGVFEPREVVEILRAGGEALLGTGVKDGERVVATATFLLDSESRLRAALGAATTAGHPGSDGPR